MGYLLKYKTNIWKIKAAKYAFLFGILLISNLLLIFGIIYYGISLYLIGYRLIDEEIRNNKKKGKKVEKKILYIYDFFFNRIKRMYFLKKNRLYDSFVQTKVARKYKKTFENFPEQYQYRLKIPKENDFEERQGDLMIIKEFDPISNEKGVLLIKYTESFAKFAATFDLKKIAKRYQLVLEPSWWGYQNAFILLYYNIGTEVVIESPYGSDYRFIQKLNQNFYPIRIGSGDWIDPQKFSDGKEQEKVYDIVMVGNWSTIKRHKILFRAIAKTKNHQDLKIALIGYPSKNRCKEDILKEAAIYGVEKTVSLFERIPPGEVASILRQSKVNVLLSKAEGANRGIYEGLLSGNVIILYRHNKGVNRIIINKETGFLCDDHELHEVIVNALKNYQNYNTGEWARKNTGYEISHSKLNKKMKSISIRNGLPWTKDIAVRINRPNLLYAVNTERIRFDKNIKNWLIA